MKISETGLSAIKQHEALRLESYPDPGTGEEPWTIGYGHTGKDIRQGLTITEEEANQYLRNDIGWVEDCVNENVTVELTQSQFDALCSLIFNIGCKAFAGSTLLRLLNEKHYEAAEQQFARWNKAAGKVLAGLTKRRKDEAELFHA